MNPYEPRGLELPEGCRDLIEALNLAGPEQPKAASFCGGVADIDGHIAVLLRAPPAVRWLVVLWPGQSDFVYLVYADGSLSVVFDSSRGSGGHEQAIRRMFQDAGIAPMSESVGGGGSFASLRYPLPSIGNGAAELMREVLLRGCVVPERARLVFRLYGHLTA